MRPSLTYRIHRFHRAARIGCLLLFFALWSAHQLTVPYELFSMDRWEWPGKELSPEENPEDTGEEAYLLQDDLLVVRPGSIPLKFYLSLPRGQNRLVRIPDPPPKWA